MQYYRGILHFQRDFAVTKEVCYFKYFTSFFYSASKRNLQCRKTMRRLQSLFWKPSFTPHSSQYTINISSKYCSNRKGENRFSELGAGTMPTQNEDFLVYCKKSGLQQSCRSPSCYTSLITQTCADQKTKRSRSWLNHSLFLQLFLHLPLWNDCTPTFSPTFLFLVVRIYGLPHCKRATCRPDASRANTAITYTPGSPQLKKFYDGNAHINKAFA